ncbi:MAG: DivIVA domain-containing protein [Coriobacteriia bacterium]|nr:DivIVA domain-containing protein [Coriobacteriia bacterium]
MAITSNDIATQSFNIERRGYDVDEVDVFLEKVAAEIDSMNQEISQLKSQLAEAKAAAERATAQPTVAMKPNAAKPAVVTESEKDKRIAELEAKLSEQTLDQSAISAALITAQKTGDEVISKAKAEAEVTRQNAEDEARRILDKANAEKGKVVEHINELNESRAAIREQYQEMLKDFIGTCTMRLTEIGGEATSGISVDAIATESAAQSAAKWDASSAAATYTTPVAEPAATPAAFRPSAAAKDLSGYGDADDTFAFDEID